MMQDDLGFVMGINLVIWVGIAAYLLFLDIKIKRLEKKYDDEKL